MSAVFTPTTVPLLVAVLALVAAVAVPLITALTGRGASRADAAEKFTRMAASVADDYDQLRTDVRELKELVGVLIHVVENVIPLLHDEHPTVADGLRDASNAVRKVI